jgi:LCP family protein required for cell wall assembly
MTLPNRPRPKPRYDPNTATRVVPPYRPNQSPPSPSPRYPVYTPQYPPLRDQRHAQRRQKNLKLGCGLGLGLIIIIALCLGSLAVTALFIAPVKTNILVIGIDRVPEGTEAGRSDTNVLVRVNSTQPRMTTLAIPRDLWVPISANDENRINTAHFYGELAEPGSGPTNAMLVFQQNFGIPIEYYVRIRLEGVPGLIDAMGGITLDLSEEMAGYPAGKHNLNGTQALAFVRDRKGTDDFFRMAQGQIFIKAAAQQMLNPLTWLRVPLILAAFQKTVDTNLSFWQLANIAMTVVRLGPVNIESHVLPREDTTPADIGGAQVLLPVWERINPLIDQLFK